MKAVDHPVVGVSHLGSDGGAVRLGSVPFAQTRVSGMQRYPPDRSVDRAGDRPNRARTASDTHARAAMQFQLSDRRLLACFAMAKRETLYLRQHRFTGEAAAGYNDRRSRFGRERVYWHAEVAALRKIFSEHAPGALVLDTPVGTGRLLPVVRELGMACVGADISFDMLKQGLTQDRFTSLRGQVQCDIQSLPFRDQAFSYVLSFRFFHFVPHAAVAPILQELRRLVTNGIVAEFRLLGDAPRAVIAGWKVLRLIRQPRKILALIRRIPAWLAANPDRRSALRNLGQAVKTAFGLGPAKTKHPLGAAEQRAPQAPGSFSWSLNELRFLAGEVGLSLRSVHAIHRPFWRVLVFERLDSVETVR